MRLSITLRVALLVASLTILASLVVLGFIYLRTADDAAHALRQQVTEEASAFREVFARSGRDALDAAIDDASDDPRFLGALVDSRGQTVSGDVALTPPARLVEGYATGLLDPDGPAAPVNAGYVLHAIAPGTWLLSGRSFEERLTFQQTLERSLLLALLVAALVGTLSGLLVARYVGRRVQAIGSTARRIAAADFSHRVPVLGTNDPFDRLGGEINQMLDRITNLMNELRMLTDCLAHDLRSPVGRLRARVDAALSTADPEHRDLMLGGVLNEADSLMRILSTVLEIGRSEAMTSRDQFDWIEPHALIAELVDMYEPLVDDEGARIGISTCGVLLPLFGHRQLLAQALSNLIENALKYAAGGGEIVIEAEQGEHELRLAVVDRGPGIAEGQMAEARRRFGRLDQARQTAGAGLGLTLVDAVAHLHNGRLELTDNAPGLRAAMVLPSGTTGS